MKAHEQSVPLEFNSDNPLYANSSRKYQGVPTLAITKGGRIFVGWCSGGDSEPRMENYDVLHYSDDLGKTWCARPVVAMESDKARMVHVFDNQVWVDDEGKLHVMWIQDDVTDLNGRNIPPWSPEHPVVVERNYVYDDMVHSTWEITCDNPDADDLVFSAPKFLSEGFTRCNPLKTASGKVFLWAYDQTSDKYTFGVSSDNGNTYERWQGGKKVRTPFDGGMAYQMQDGAIRFMARSEEGSIAESYSYDDGKTWTDGKSSGITAPSSRLFVSRTPSGRIILVHNDHDKRRTNMTVKLSEDDGKTWKYSLCIDDRNDLSYPDLDFYDGRIYLVYDRGRRVDNEILFTSFTEEDVINGVKPEIKVLSKPNYTEI